ncbi:leucine-rich_repeat domain-containing protein [Hexamita inflata]|uniref:Leucine-rich_repeat domain-containing protein n=1 Tax=Hexamita inflata TaxID=28002 RepID=A0ABP1HJV1_9EUKA
MQSIIDDQKYEQLSVLSGYDKDIIQRYQSQIKDQTLTIEQIKDLKSLDFINTLKIQNLDLYDCKGIIPKLESQTIKQLQMVDCQIFSLKDFQLENLEVLKLENYQKFESKTLVLEIIRFLKLTELNLNGWVIDITPLSQMIGLTKLNLNCCNLQSTKSLIPLINLEELCLDFNYDGIEITSLQYLTKLTKLSIRECDLVSLDELRPLTKLVELNIFGNDVVFLQPLMELNQLSRLYASCNKIIDFKVIEQHTNFKNFTMKFQKQPTQDQLKAANIYKFINSPVISLKKIYNKQSHTKQINVDFRKKVAQLKFDLFNNHEQFLSRTASLFQKMNEYENIQ